MQKEAGKVEGRYRIHIMLSHLHWDMICGLPGFAPLYNSRNRITFYGPPGFQKVIEPLLNADIVPEVREPLSPEIDYREYDSSVIGFRPFEIGLYELNHPLTTFGFRIKVRNKVLAYAINHEPPYSSGNKVLERRLEKSFRDLISNADTLVGEGRYLPAEYRRNKGNGNAPLHYLLNEAEYGGVKRMIYTYHDTERSDDQIDRIYSHYRRMALNKNISVNFYPAREQHEVNI